MLSLPPLRGGPLTVHEATGGYVVRSPCPSGIPRPRHNAVLPWTGGIASVLTSALAAIAKSGLEIENRCTDYSSFDLLAASIRKFGLEIKNRCTVCPCFDLLAASIRKSGPEIENRCTDCPCFGLFAASIHKSGLEIENRCTEVPGMRHKAAAIAKLPPSNQESLQRHRVGK